MDLLVIRHAIAQTRERFAHTGQPDELRPLTAAGRSKMQRGARGIVAVAPRLARMATSPLVRASETAAIVAEAYRGMRVEEADVLAPDVPLEGTLAWLDECRLAVRDGVGPIAIVGHEPHLGRLASWLLTGSEGGWIPLKKGGACLVAFDGELQPGAATLRWLLTPWQLRRLGR
jgi:phosphohistidine phosphatase